MPQRHRSSGDSSRGPALKYAVITFGCRVNQADSQQFEEELRARGAVCAAPEEADLVIINTCSVTATADQGARQTIRRVVRDNPAASVVVAGCYATRRPDELAALPGVDRVIVNDHKPQLVSLTYRSAEGDGPCGAPIEPGVAGRTAFTLRVQTGCDESCAYCIIPSTRGKARSVAIGEVQRQVARAIEAGFKEIVLTGVHLGSWGRDFESALTLRDLLRVLDRTGPLFRISSLEPMDCTPELVDYVAQSDSFAPHFHLPLQHASDRMLAAMRRPYTSAHYASLVSSIRSQMPSASIGTDIIVGFPGETGADFDALTTFLESSPLTHLHVFPYSDRPGTAASELPDKVHGAVIRERARRVRDIGQQLAARFRDNQVGTVHRSLTLEDGSLVVTDNYLKLRIPPGRARNEWVRVRVRSHQDGELLAG
jgi:threonylcarbamoyladenosine tRNA methylthiotransferase MtaB